MRKEGRGRIKVRGGGRKQRALRRGEIRIVVRLRIRRIKGDGGREGTKKKEE